MTKWKKMWVHIRFLIKFIPVQLLGVGFNIYGAGFALLGWAMFGYSNFLLCWFLIGTLFLPIAIILDSWLGKLSPLWFMMDDSRFKFVVIKKGGAMWELAKDYKQWLDGRMINFFTDWLWHTRNRTYNFLSLFNKPDGKEYLVQLLQNSLKLRGEEIQLTDDYGFMEHDNFAGLKWVTKSGDESWWTYKGIKISQLYSIFGIMKLYYRIGDALYYKYSKCIPLENKYWILFFRVIILLFMFKNTFKKELWFTFKYHPNNKTGTIHIKIQWEK